jgi:hypothetical protein
MENELERIEELEKKEAPASLAGFLEISVSWKRVLRR